MKYFFFPIENLELTDLDQEYFELMPGIRITNSEKVKQKLLNDQFIKVLGVINTNHLRECKCLFVYQFTEEDIEDHFKGLPNLGILTILLLWIDDLLKNSWLLKDNCINGDTAYLLDEITSPDSVVSSLRFNYIHSTAYGFTDTVSKLTLKELKDWRDLSDKMEIYLHSKDSQSTKFSMTKNYSRIGRFIFFIKYAREARNQGHKILNYCSAFETILSTDNFEIAHKIAERAAFFNQTEFEKHETFRLVKKAYNVRSKLTHGASMSQKDIDELPELSVKLDSILRATILKIMDNESLIEIMESKKDRITEYFNNLILK